MTYEEAVSSLETLWRTQGISPGLERICWLLRALDDLENAFPKILVAGTNGKGTVCSIHSAVLTKAGYQTGLYLSPHMERYSERYRINDREIPPERFADLYEKVSALIVPCTQAAGAPTEFELLTAMAFLLFAEEKVEIAVLEAGLGGRFDSTNVGEPLVSAITSIGMDHIDFLGDSLSKIALEKSGVMRRGRRVVCGELPYEAKEEVEKQARLKGAQIVAIGQGSGNIFAKKENSRWGTRIEGDSRGRSFDGWLPFVGVHQAGNAAIAKTMLDSLRPFGFDISDMLFWEGAASATLPGRFEIVGENPFIILDGAHNPAAAEKLSETLDAFPAPRPRILVFAALKTKDLSGVLAELSRAVDSIIVTETPHPSHRTLPELLDAAQSHGKPSEAIQNPEEAISRACQQAGTDGTVIVTGSFSLVGSIRPSLLRGNLR